MKTNLEIIAVANEVFESVSKTLRDSNREFTSISSVLRFMQDTTDGAKMAEGYKKVLAELGIDVSGAITPKDIFDSLDENQWVEVTSGRGKNKVTNKVAGIWTNVQKKDEEGNKMFTETGTPIVEQVCRPVKSWSPSKVAKILAQATAFYNARHEEDIEEGENEEAA